MRPYSACAPSAFEMSRSLNLTVLDMTAASPSAAPNADADQPSSQQAANAATQRAGIFTNASLATGFRAEDARQREPPSSAASLGRGDAVRCVFLPARPPADGGRQQGRNRHDHPTFADGLDGRLPWSRGRACAAADAVSRRGDV